MSRVEDIKMAERATSLLRLTDEVKQAWKSEYTHPLFLNSMHYNQGDLGRYEIFRFDNLNDIANNDHMNDIFFEAYRKTSIASRMTSLDKPFERANRNPSIQEEDKESDKSAPPFKIRLQTPKMKHQEILFSNNQPLDNDTLFNPETYLDPKFSI